MKHITNNYYTARNNFAHLLNDNKDKNEFIIIKFPSQTNSENQRLSDEELLATAQSSYVSSDELEKLDKCYQKASKKVLQHFGGNTINFNETISDEYKKY